MSNTPLMSTRDLSVHYPLRGGGLFGPKPVVRAVEGVNIDINGCGKPVRRKYRPGHDQSMRIAIEKEVGGLERLREIVEELVGHRITPPWEYLKLCVWRSAHAVKTGHLLNRSG